MTPERQTVLLLDDDPAIVEGLALGLQRDGRTVITCGDLESAQMMVERVRISDVVTDVRLSGPFAFEGLDLIRHVTRYSPASRIVLMTGNGTPEMEKEAQRRGATAFLNKPFEIEQLEELLHSEMLDPSDRSAEIIRVPTLEEILVSDGLSQAFQPIVEIGAESRNVFAYESLARLLTETPFQNPEILFQYAFRKKRIADLELVCLRNSIHAAGRMGGEALIFLNIHPMVFSSGRQLLEGLFEAAERAGVPPARLVLEITEQSSLEEPVQWSDTVRTLSEAGIRFAFDDVGIAYSHLMYMNHIKPAFLKISQQFGTGFESDPARQKIVRNIVALAADFGASVILEGVETQETLDAARQLGIPYGQGYFLGRPQTLLSF